MLPKENRITTERFKEVFSNGEVQRSSIGLVKSLPSNLPRFAVVVSKKILKGAVARNVVSRRVYNFLENNLDSYKDNDYIIVVSKSFVEASKEEQKELLNKLSLV